MNPVPITLRCERTGRWWALNRQEDGFASYGYPFDYLGDALDAFNAHVIAWGRDHHGLYLLAARRHGRSS